MSLYANHMSAQERELIDEMVSLLTAKLERDYPSGPMPREAHPKTLGLLRGELNVAADLPAHLVVGVFQPEASYECWVRVSSSSTQKQSDAEPDLRGFAIKLLPHASLRDNGPAKATLPLTDPSPQDFVLLSHPTMPLGTVELFRDATYYLTKGSPVGLIAKFLVTGHVGALKQLYDARSCPTSPFDIRYWSTTPYCFGGAHVVKYGLLPTSATRSVMPPVPGEDYLSEAMARHLDGSETSFDLCVQFRHEGMPVEDAAVLWDEAVSPFIKVATLRIPQQEFRTKERAAFAEELTFSPANAWPAHEPLGGLNRARAIVYRELARFRQARNEAASHRVPPAQEPSDVHGDAAS